MQELYSLIVPFVREKVLTERHEKGLPHDALTMTKEYALQLHAEVSELISEFPWKHHRGYDDGAQALINNVAEELVDIIFFTISTAYVNGITPEQLMGAARVKSVVVQERWRQEKDTRQWSDKGIVLIDLDGVLNEYPAPLVDYANKVYATPEPPFWTWEELNAPKNREVFKRVKHDYRQSGAKRHLTPIHKNIAVATKLSQIGYDVVIMSKRPAKQYANILGDTLYWLADNYVPFRKLLFVEDKELQVVIGGLKDKIRFAVDDDPDNVDRLRDLGIVTYYVTTREPREIHDIRDMGEIQL